MRCPLERLEERIFLADDPVAAIEVADTNIINKDINFTVSFDNDSAGTDVGYQLHLDVVVEKGTKVSGAKNRIQKNLNTNICNPDFRALFISLQKKVKPYLPE